MVAWLKRIILLALLGQLLQLVKSEFFAAQHGNGVYTLANCSRQHLLDLSDVAHIRELQVEDCDIPHLENAFFIRFSSLSALELTASRLTSLEDYALHGLKHLKLLSLARNNISEVKSWSNEQMSALISLDLRHNAIRTLSLKSFFRYPNLQRLNLAQNHLEYIEDGIFRWMPHLKNLNLGRNRLHRIMGHYFHGMQRLALLSLHNNEIAQIAPTAFQTNTHLRALKLEGNRLADLSFMLVKSMARLVHLNLSHNALATLEHLSFSPDSELTDLDLSYNTLTAVPASTFAELQLLERLNISHNSIHTIEPHSFVALSSLQFIDLSANNLTHLAGELFNGTQLLQRINLSRNALDRIAVELFAGMPYLTMLDLSANRLHAYNFIDTLAPALKRAELSLILSDNQFDALNVSALLAFERVELAGNRWRCDWLIQEMLRMPRSIHFGRNHSVVTIWSAALLDATGFDCYDDERQRSLIILDTAQLWTQRAAPCKGGGRSNEAATATSLPWPKLRLDRFDSRSVIIWMLIGIAIAFSALRIARQIIDHKERKKMLLDLKRKQQILNRNSINQPKPKSPNQAVDVNLLRAT